MLLRIEANERVYLFDEETTVLVVDDDPILRELAIVELASPKTHVLCAGDGREALDILASRKVDIVLSDLHMPEVDGFSLLSALRKQPERLHLPFIMATTRDDIFAIDRAYELGATTFVTKPLNWRLVGHLMRYVLRASRAEAQLRHSRDIAEAAASLKNNILALMTHETRTPLSVIMGYADILGRNPVEKLATEESAAAAAAIRNSAEQLYATLGSLQLFAEIAGASGRPCLDRAAAAEVAAAGIREARLAAIDRNRVTLDRKASANVEIVCDIRLASAAIGQVVNNAIRHGGEHSDVRITIEDQPDAVVFQVADSGRGMEHPERVLATGSFLERGDNFLRHGSGLKLGLPIAQRVCALHGGSLSLVSTLGLGTRVTLSFPKTDSSPSAQGENR
jgi:signal transduction histidine kinase